MREIYVRTATVSRGYRAENSEWHNRSVITALRACYSPLRLSKPLAEVRRPRQRCFRLGNEFAHNLAYRHNFIDASGGLARREQTLVSTPCLGH